MDSRLTFRTCLVPALRVLLVAVFFTSAVGYAAPDSVSSSSNSPPARSSTAPGDSPTRSFEVTLRDLFRAFDRDLRSRELPIRNAVIVRAVEAKGDLPASFRTHLRARVGETLVGAKISVRPVRPDVEGATERRSLREVRYLDASLYFDRQRMVLSVSIVDAETATLLRQLNYDSEEWRAGASDFRLNLTEAPVTKVMQYAPSILYGARFALASLPDLDSRKTAGEFGVRALERFSNRRYELGVDLSTVIANDSGSRSAYHGVVVQSVLMVGRSAFDDFEDYDRPRVVTYLGIGGTYANGFLGSLFRLSGDLRLGKSFALQASVGYRPRSLALLTKESESVGGVDASLGILVQFESYGRSR